MRKTVIGVMGPGENATTTDCQLAYELGQLIAQEGWILLTGGRSVGVMAAASEGAKSHDGLTLGILPNDTDQGLSTAIDIAIFTGMGSARNNINVLSSDVVVICGMGAGTASEAALAIKAGKPIVLLNLSQKNQDFFIHLSSDLSNDLSSDLSNEQLLIAENSQGAIALIKTLLKTV